MAHRVCPWWLGYLLASPLRRLFQDPRAVVEPYVQPGMTVVEPGPGMGFFTLELARLVGPRGKVIAIDVQPKMIRSLMRRARRAGVADRIESRIVAGNETGMDDLLAAAGFILVFAVAHEMPDVRTFFTAAARALQTGGTMLLAEPRGHVDAPHFTETVRAAEATGLRRIGSPAIRHSHAALLEKPTRGEM